MVKAVFVDYTGTLVADMDQNTLEVAERCYKNSSIESVEAMTAYMVETGLSGYSDSQITGGNTGFAGNLLISKK